MKNDNKKKKLLAAAAVLAIIAMMSGTFAWLRDRDERVNRTTSAAVVDGSVTVEEIWKPKPITAGMEAEKKVSILNSGSSKVFVRASYEEVLKHLEGAGQETYSGSDVAGAKYTPGQSEPHIPIRYPGDSVINDASFTEVPTGQVTGGLPTGVRLFVKGQRETNPSTGDEERVFEVKIMHEYATGEYQKMDVEPVVANENGSTQAEDWTFTLNNVTYGYYENGYKYTVANWAESSIPNLAGTQTGHALLGTHETTDKYGYEYDYREATLGINPLPNPNPIAAGDADRLPTPGLTDTRGVQTDLAGLGKNEIRIKYGVDIVTPSTLSDGKWVYNPADGWFYYTVALEGGQRTPNLMESIIFSDTMGKEYTNTTYDLIVKMEAIQAKNGALSSDTGWDMDTTDAGTETIVNYLKVTGED